MNSRVVQQNERWDGGIGSGSGRFARSFVVVHPFTGRRPRRRRRDGPDLVREHDDLAQREQNRFHTWRFGRQRNCQRPVIAGAVDTPCILSTSGQRKEKTSGESGPQREAFHKPSEGGVATALLIQTQRGAGDKNL